MNYKEWMKIYRTGDDYGNTEKVSTKAGNEMQTFLN